MYFKDVGYLCKEISTVDKNKRPKISYDEKIVYCNIKSIGLTEFYQAQSVGLKPEVKIECKLVNLEGITHFKYDNRLYKILRINKKEDLTEIILSSFIIKNE